MRTQHKILGFTLVELAIVLVIVGLLIAGVLSGREMIMVARNYKYISTMGDYKTAINAFVTKYGNPPGDTQRATAFFGGGTVNGDGNGVINVTAGGYKESVLLWEHLSRAKMLKGSFSTTGTDLGDWMGKIVVGVNAPASNFDGQFTVTGVRSVPVPGDTDAAEAYSYIISKLGKHKIAICHEDSDAELSYYCISTANTSFYTENAIFIDTKMDDGIADTGIVISSSCNMSNGLGNFEDTNGGGAHPYDLTNATVPCGFAVVVY